MSTVNYQRYAVIDIGTNSAILLVCDVNHRTQEYDVVLDTAEITRLGQGLHPTRCLQPSSIERTFGVIRQYLRQTENLDVDQTVIVGTNALRVAENAHRFIDLVQDEFELGIEVISAQTEAHFSYLSVKEDQTFRSFETRKLMVIDIGGGSTEQVFYDDELVCLSVPFGIVSLTDRFVKNDPPTDQEIREIETFIEETLVNQGWRTKFQVPIVLVGIGGTIVNLAAIESGLIELDLSVVHGQVLDRRQILNRIDLFRSLTVDTLRRVPGLEVKRAEVMLAGTLILRSLMDYIGVDQIHVSTRGIRYGVMIDRFLAEGTDF
ncbi:hypothetical protein CMK22_01725 [Candidatus Poribacteria bacterium]|nr:hypothetical protein [Candidatus Poribacteria bacterium]